MASRRAWSTNDYNTLQPRVGFSEDLFGNGKTVLRGGFGTFFERCRATTSTTRRPTPPFAYNPSASATSTSAPEHSWVTGQVTAANSDLRIGRLTNLAQTYKAPAVAQFSLGVQHEMKPSVIWVVQYVGNLAWHQNIERAHQQLPA